MSETKLLNIRIEAELKKKAKILAEQDGRSLSNWIKHLIKTELKRADAKDNAAPFQIIDLEAMTAGDPASPSSAKGS